MGIRSERRLCDEVHLNLAYRWFYRLGFDGRVPDHSTFSKNRHGRIRDSDVLRQLFEATVATCMAEGLVGGDTRHSFISSLCWCKRPALGQSRRARVPNGTADHDIASHDAPALDVRVDVCPS